MLFLLKFIFYYSIRILREKRKKLISSFDPLNYLLISFIKRKIPPNNILNTPLNNTTATIMTTSNTKINIPNNILPISIFKSSFNNFYYRICFFREKKRTYVLFLKFNSLSIFYHYNIHTHNFRPMDSFLLVIRIRQVLL